MGVYVEAPLGNGVPAMARHLTKEERDRIAQLLHRGMLQREIAQALGRDPGTISRELGRNRVGREYFAAQAHDLAGQRRRQRPLARKLDDPELNAVVRHGLAQEWSPEQIAGSQKREHQGEPGRHVSARTIYSWIEQDEHRERARERSCDCRKFRATAHAPAARPAESERAAGHAGWARDPARHSSPPRRLPAPRT